LMLRVSYQAQGTFTTVIISISGRNP